MDEPTILPPPKEGAAFRAVIGLLCLVGGLVGFAMLFWVRVPTENRDAMMLALGIVMGWGSAVVQSEYGASSTGRKAADATIKRAER
jgi:hypothetical protein